MLLRSIINLSVICLISSAAIIANRALFVDAEMVEPELKEVSPTKKQPRSTLIRRPRHADI